MKRYEKMSKEEMMDIVGVPIECDICSIKQFCNAHPERSCTETRAAYLNQEIKIVPRVATINTVEKLEEARKEFEKYYGANIFANYLEEEIEVYE